MNGRSCVYFAEISFMTSTRILHHHGEDVNMAAGEMTSFPDSVSGHFSPRSITQCFIAISLGGAVGFSDRCIYSLIMLFLLTGCRFPYNMTMEWLIKPFTTAQLNASPQSNASIVHTQHSCHYTSFTTEIYGIWLSKCVL